MKKHLFRISMIAALATGASFAQLKPIVQVHVPFGFVAGNKTLPAGDYTVGQMPNAPVLAIQSSDYQTWMLGTLNYAKSPKIQERGRLVFHRYGDTYILAEMWEAGSAEGFQLPKTALERELITQAAHTSVTIATR
jgi:hypothetical protein